MLFSLSIYGFICLAFLLIFYKRETILQHLPPSLLSRIPARFLPSSSTGGYAPLNTFAGQRAAGLSSANFDLESNNILAGDSRVGLDERGVAEVREIMQRERVGFDQARLIRQNRILAANGIDPSGMPLDSKAVTRL